MKEGPREGPATSPFPVVSIPGFYNYGLIKIYLSSLWRANITSMLKRKLDALCVFLLNFEMHYEPATPK